MSARQFFNPGLALPIGILTIILLMAIELMLLAVNLNFIAFFKAIT